MTEKNTTKMSSGKTLPTGTAERTKGVLVVDTAHCAACRNCMYACALQHEGAAALDVARIQVPYEGRSAFDVYAEPCLQCDDPLCMRYCPKHAIHVDPVTGARVIDEDLCIGCRLCIKHCPYSPPRIRYDAVKKKAVKCDLCGGDPQCVRVCPNGSLTYRYDPNGISTGHGSSAEE